VTLDGIITTIAGNGSYGDSGDGAGAAEAEVNSPQGLAVDSAGNVYIADVSNNAIRLLQPNPVPVTANAVGNLGQSGLRFAPKIP